MPEPDELLPLSPIVYHMLLALFDGEKHGYGIMKTVEDDTNGQMSIPLGTLYGSIKRMLAAGLIAETGERPDPESDDERRRYYQITGFGQQVLRAETRRLSSQVALAEAKRVLG
jgi:DNA-binding PadR family transcriptional regulator